MKLTPLAGLLPLLLLACSGGNPEGAACRNSDPPPGDPNHVGSCASGLVCDISEGCQEGPNVTCTGVCRKDCSSGQDVCTGGRSCSTVETPDGYRSGPFCRYADGG